MLADKLLARGAELLMDDADAAGELCEYARKGKIERVSLLIQGKCNPNAGDYDQRTCLHLASCEGNLHVIHLLTEHGADLNVKDRWGGSALQDALREGHVKVAQELFAQGAQLLMDEATCLLYTSPSPRDS